MSACAIMMVAQFGLHGTGEGVRIGMIPDVAGTMATSPVLIDSLVGLLGKVHGGSFTEAQIQALILTNAVTNGSSCAVAFHTGLALEEGLDQADVQAVRERRVPKGRYVRRPLKSSFLMTISNVGSARDTRYCGFPFMTSKSAAGLRVLCKGGAHRLAARTAMGSSNADDQPF